MQADSPASLCGHHIEDSIHYLLHCPMYSVHIQHMLQNLLIVIDGHEVSTLLNGIESGNLKINADICSAVYT